MPDAPESSAPTRVAIYTDGACDPNPGTGGWAAILVAPGTTSRKEISGAQRNSTNNRMELTAAIEGLRALKKPCKVDLYTDSQYVHHAFVQGWLANWQRNGWRTAGRKPVLNDDLWRDLLELTQIHDVRWHWVRGHAANPMNNRCDELAVAARVKLARE